MLGYIVEEAFFFNSLGTHTTIEGPRFYSSALRLDFLRFRSCGVLLDNVETLDDKRAIVVDHLSVETDSVVAHASGDRSALESDISDKRVVAQRGMSINPDDDTFTTAELDNAIADGRLAACVDH